jgi:RNA polymerase sigma-70 factor (ECF subfamily)
MAAPPSTLPLALSGSLSGELERLYVLHRSDVHRIALRYGGCRTAWAEDVVQDVFLALAGALDELDERDDLMGWLFRVTTRRCLQRLERERFAAWAPIRWSYALMSSSPRPPEEIVAERGEVDRALLALSLLPPKERVAFSLIYIDGLSVDEAGRVLGHSKGYISKLVHRAEVRLAEVLR